MTRKDQLKQLEAIKPFVSDLLYSWIKSDIKEGYYDGANFWLCLESTIEALIDECDEKENKKLDKSFINCLKKRGQID